MKLWFKIAATTAVLLACNADTTRAEIAEKTKYNGYIELEGRKGNQRNISEISMFLPLKQTNKTLLFANVRGFGDNQKNREGSIGLGLRRIVHSKFAGYKWVLGGHLFWDRRKTAHDNMFTQHGIGLEALSKDFDIRINGYLPERDSKQIGSGNNTGLPTDLTAVVIGTQLRLQGTGASAYERAVPGFDFEVGYRWPVFENHIDHVRTFAGGYYFDNVHVPHMFGRRGRLEIGWDDLPYLGYGSRFTLGGELQRDNIRGTNAYATARLRIPLNAVTGFDADETLSLTEQRMTERVVRDVDIISHAEEQDTSVDEAAKVVLNGTDITNVVVLDATDDVPTEVTNAGGGAAILLNGDAGTIDNGANTISPLTGQTIVGGGVQFIGLNTGLTATYGSRPTITSDGTHDVFDLAGPNTDVTIENISITGGRAAIDINTGADRTTLNNISITNAGNTGIQVTSSDNTLSNLTLTNITGRGITFDSGDNNSLSDTTIDTTTNNGVYTFTGTSASDNLSLDNVTINNAGNAGFYGRDGDSYSINNVTIDGSNTHNFIINNLTNLSGTNNTSTNPTFLHCNTGGVNTGSFDVNAGTCP